MFLIECDIPVKIEFWRILIIIFHGTIIRINLSKKKKKKKKNTKQSFYLKVARCVIYVSKIPIRISCYRVANLCALQ